MTEYEVISEPGQLASAVQLLRMGTGPIAVDVERASGFRYSQRAYLIQIFRRESGVFLIDPPAFSDLTELAEVLRGEEWVLHAASQDLPSLREEGLDPDTIFDTELAARLLGHERVGLGAVVETTMGITLAKEHSASDWSIRPLPAEWLEYAANDVLHLIGVRDALAGELDQQGKTRAAAEEFDAVRTRLPKPALDEPWRRLSGLHQVHGPRALAVARALWQARDEYAREQDVAPGRLVPDRSLVAAVLAEPTSAGELARLKGFTGRASRVELPRWWAAIEAGRAEQSLPAERTWHADTLPPPRAWRDRNPTAFARLVAARAAVQSVADEITMPTENLVTPESLRRVCWEPPEPADADRIAQALRALGARPWQVEHTAAVIAEAFVQSLQDSGDTSPAAS